MPTYKPITLKMSTAPAYGYTSIKQMDVEGVELILTLKNTDDSDYNLTSGSTLFFKMANESGNVKVTLSEMDSPSNITRDGANVVKVLLTESMVSETGIMACELQEMHSGTFTSSQLFYLRVWPTTEDGEIIDSHEYKSLVSAYLAIDNALNVATLAKNYSESTITEENARQAAELLRIQAENDRVLAESARVAAENLRGVEIANARGDHATLGDRLDEMDVGIEGNTSEVENTKLKVIRLEEEVETARGEFDALGDRLDEMDVGIEGNTSEVENTKLKVIRLEEEVETARGEFDALGDRLDEMDVGIEGNTSEVENTKLKVIRLEEEVETARGEFDALGDRLDEMDVGIEGNTSEVENTKLKVIRLEEEVETARGEFDALGDRLDEMDVGIEGNTSEVENTKLKVIRLEEEVETARGEFDALGDRLDEMDVEGVLQEVGSELVTHKADTMPHKFEDLKNTVTYKFGFQLSAEGNPQIIFEEVV